jgi:hypothetical protein
VVDVPRPLPGERGVGIGNACHQGGPPGAGSRDPVTDRRGHGPGIGPVFRSPVFWASGDPCRLVPGPTVILCSQRRYWKNRAQQQAISSFAFFLRTRAKREEGWRISDPIIPAQSEH